MVVIAIKVLAVLSIIATLVVYACLVLGSRADDNAERCGSPQLNQTSRGTSPRRQLGGW